MIKMQPNHAQYICPTQIQERPVWIKSIQSYKDTVWENEGLKQNLNCGIKNAKNACSEFENKKNPVHSTFVQTKPVHCSCRSIALWS